jgi:DNA-binding transcriptional LysR family regulator
MDLSDLRIFKAVAEEGGVIRAARRIGRVPSNVTTRIKQLEESVGVQLFFRDKRGMVLSSHGRALLGYADRLLQLADEARASFAGAGLDGVLKLGSLESTAASRLPALLAAFHEAHPDVRVELTTGTNDALTAAVAARRLDAAFVVDRPAARELAAIDMYAERLVLISACGHAPIEGARSVQHETLIVFPNGCAYRRRLERWLGHRAIANRRVLELASYHAIVACVAAGAGIALVPEAVLGTVHADSVVVHPLAKVHAELKTPLIWRAAEETRQVTALRDLAVMHGSHDTARRPVAT